MRSTKSNLLKLVKQRVTKCESKKVLILTEKSGDDKQPNKLLQNVWDTKWELEGKMMKAQYPHVYSIQKKYIWLFVLHTEDNTSAQKVLHHVDIQR